MHKLNIKFSIHAMIKELVKKYGAANIAAQLNESAQTINNWAARGVPPKDGKTIAFCRAVNFDVTPHQLNPTEYPYPDDGLPPEYRSNHDNHLGRRSNDRRHRLVVLKATA